MPLTMIDRLRSARKHYLGRRFDRRHGVETTGTLTRDRLTGMPPEQREHAGDYVPSDIGLFRRIVRKSRVDPAQFTFIDLGSGKGRVAIDAARYPFKAIVGVEADAGLHRIALENSARRRGEARCRDVQFVHADARKADLPDGHLFIYMYSPFRGPVFERVVVRLARIAREPGRAVLIAYSSDFEADKLDRTGAFLRVRMPRRQFWKRPTVSYFYNEAALAMRG
jgi:SAM-dependent methyltransferase